MKIPSEHGQALLDPPPGEWPGLLEANLRCDLSPVLAEIRRSARGWLAAHCGIEAGQPLVLTGHQPQFVHPGIWARHLLLDLLRERFGWQAAAFQVDSDLAAALGVTVPALRQRQALREQVPLRVLGGDTFESLSAPTPVEWRGFLGGVRSALASLPEGDALAAFERVAEYHPAGHSFADFVSDLRRRAEGNPGYAEFPLSGISSSEAFRAFAALILEEATSYAKIQNRALAAWRERHKARSAAVPFPDLEVVPGKVELPFWWTEGGHRLPLFLRGVRLFAGEAELGELPQVLDRGWVRPRAITLTIFARLMLCDFFLHGAGGADYDQATDEVIRQFFRVEAPRFASVTLTLFFPGWEKWQATPGKDRLRDMEHHPERYLGVPEVERLRFWVKQKEELLGRGKLGKEAFRELQSTNAVLREAIAGPLAEQAGHLALEEAMERIFRFREYPFFCFPVEKVRAVLEKRLA